MHNDITKNFLTSLKLKVPSFPLTLVDERTDKQALPKRALRSLWYRSLTRGVSHCVLAPSPLVLAVIYVDRDRMRLLNKTYRGIARVTDVLSYGYTDSTEAPREGEIIICPDVALKQRHRFKTSILHEFARLFFHGLLHIYGYDHMRPAQRREMRAREECLMERYRLSSPRKRGSPLTRG